MYDELTQRKRNRDPSFRKLAGQYTIRRSGWSGSKRTQSEATSNSSGFRLELPLKKKKERRRREGGKIIGKLMGKNARREKKGRRNDCQFKKQTRNVSLYIYIYLSLSLSLSIYIYILSSSYVHILPLALFPFLSIFVNPTTSLPSSSSRRTSLLLQYLSTRQHLSSSSWRTVFSTF